MPARKGSIPWNKGTSKGWVNGRGYAEIRVGGKVTSKFPPGFYRMRNGEKAEVFAERDGALFGRITGLPTIWRADGCLLIGESDPHDLISPWTEERKPLSLWVCQTKGGDWVASSVRAAIEARLERTGPAIRMIEATPLTDAAGAMYEALFEAEACVSIVQPRSDTAEYRRILDAARAALAKAKPCTPREKALVEALREGERIEGGIHQYTPQAIRWALKVSKCLAAYDDDEIDPGHAADEADFNRDLVLGR